MVLKINRILVVAMLWIAMFMAIPDTPDRVAQLAETFSINVELFQTVAAIPEWLLWGVAPIAIGLGAFCFYKYGEKTVWALVPPGALFLMWLALFGATLPNLFAFRIVLAMLVLTALALAPLSAEELRRHTIWVFRFVIVASLLLLAFSQPAATWADHPGLFGMNRLLGILPHANYLGPVAAFAVLLELRQGLGNVEACNFVRKLEPGVAPGGNSGGEPGGKSEGELGVEPELKEKSELKGKSELPSAGGVLVLKRFGILQGAGAVLALIVLVLSDSTGSEVALLVGLLVMAVISGQSGRLRARWLRWGIPAGCAVAVIGGVSLLANMTHYQIDKLSNSRVTTWEAVIPYLWTDPLLGRGHFATYAPDIAAGIPFPSAHAHNQLLQTIVSMGIVGLVWMLILGAVIIWIIARAGKQRQLPFALAAAIFTAGLIEVPLSSPLIGSSFAVIAMICIISAYAPRRSPLARRAG